MATLYCFQSKVIRRRVPKDGRKALDVSVDRRIKKVLKRKFHEEGDDEVIAGDLNGNFTGNGTRGGRCKYFVMQFYVITMRST
jgi:hypothetical protein